MLRRSLLAASRGGRRLAGWPRGCASSSAAPVEGGASSDARSVGAVLQLRGIPTDAAAAAALDADGDGADVERRLEFLSEVGVDDLARAVKRHPGLLGYDVNATMKPVLEYLLRLGVSEFGVLLRRAPGVLGADVGALHQTVSVMRSLGVTNLARWVCRVPQLAELDIERDVRPAVERLRQFDRLKLSAVLEKVPGNLFGMGAQKLDERLGYLTEQLGGAEYVGPALTRNPNLLAYSVEENLKPKVRASPGGGGAWRGAGVPR